MMRCHAGKLFNGADVTAFAADDAALYFVALDVEDRYGVLDGRLGRYTLDRRDGDALASFVAVSLASSTVSLM